MAPPRTSDTFRCPRCEGPVTEQEEHFLCAPCEASYPVVCGIPDFRVFPDPYINLEEDREKARKLADKAESMSFLELVDYYFSITPEVPKELALQYAGWMTSGAGAARGQQLIDHLVQEAGPQMVGGRVLEVGCGSGPFVEALSRNYSQVVMTDIALRWLVIARKRAAELGAEVTWLASCAEALPFARNRFDTLVGASVLEHVRDPARFVEQTLRVLDKDGACVLTTPNRWSVGPDPHLGIWGLGLAPEGVRRTLAAWVRGLPFEKVKTRGYTEWNRLLLDGGYRRVKFALPEPPAGMGGVRGLAAGAYQAVKSTAIGRLPLLALGPGFEVLAFKGPNRS